MLTQEQRLLRMGKLGSSDAAAVLGLDEYKSASDVFLEITGQAAPFAGNEATDRGNLLERPLIEWAEYQLAADSHYTRDVMKVHPSGMLVANLDAISPGLTEIIEAKTTVNHDGWGEEGTDEVPDRVLAQIAHQFVCVPTAVVAYVPVLIPAYMKFDFRLYKVTRNADLCAAVEKSGLDFMENHVIRGIPPADFRPSLEVLKRVRRQPNKYVPVADELVERCFAAREAKAAAVKESEKADSCLLAAMADAEGGTYSGGTITYLECKRAGYTVEPTTFRQLRRKQTKQLSDSAVARSSERCGVGLPKGAALDVHSAK